MKKSFTLFLIMILFTLTAFAGEDKYSQEYLQSKNHFSILKPLNERVAKKAIQAALKRETGANFDVKFEGYTASSIKKGIFKTMELSAEDAIIDGISIPYVHLVTLSEYNYIDYTQNPIVAKSDMTYAYDMLLSDESINQALKDTDYLKVLAKVNKIANPVFVVKQVRTKITDNKLYILTDYNFPIAKSKDRTFVVQSDFQVINGKISAKNVSIDSSYGNLGLNKVANLINYLNPLEFTIKALDDNNHKAIVENINIVDNKVKVDGKIYIKEKTKM